MRRALATGESQGEVAGDYCNNYHSGMDTDPVTMLYPACLAGISAAGYYSAASAAPSTPAEAGT
jgi:hypothetical protein